MILVVIRLVCCIGVTRAAIIEIKSSKYQIRLSTLLLVLAIAGLVTSLVVTRMDYESKLKEMNARVDQLVEQRNAGQMEQARIIDLRLQRESLRGVFGPGHRQMIYLTDQIEQYENRILDMRQHRDAGSN